MGFERPPIEDVAEAAKPHSPLDSKLQNAPAALMSVIFHLSLLIALALFTYQQPDQDSLTLRIPRDAAAAPEIPIETMSFELSVPELTEPEESRASVSLPTSLVPIEDPATQGVALASIDDVFPTNMQWDALALPPMHPVSPPASQPQLDNVSPEFAEIIFDAQEHGIEILIVFDSTGSMRREIDAVKRRVGAICSAVLEKLPKARFSLVTYRDRSDTYLVRGITFDSRVPNLVGFAQQVTAAGGGDEPEALHAGMNWALAQNDFRPYSRKAMLIFGDAPPHRHFFDRCVVMARNFRHSGKACVHTVTCRRAYPLPEFYKIANAGGGRAFVFSDTRHLMEELLVLAFGPEHRRDVFEFFQLGRI